MDEGELERVLALVQKTAYWLGYMNGIKVGLQRGAEFERKSQPVRESVSVPK